MYTKHPFIFLITFLFNWHLQNTTNRINSSRHFGYSLGRQICVDSNTLSLKSTSLGAFCHRFCILFALLYYFFLYSMVPNKPFPPILYLAFFSLMYQIFFSFLGYHSHIYSILLLGEFDLFSLYKAYQLFQN